MRLLQTRDGYLEALVQEALITIYLGIPSRNWLMQVVDNFREVTPAPPATLSLKGAGKGCNNSAAFQIHRPSALQRWLLHKHNHH